jgi:hypothetical protein
MLSNPPVIAGDGLLPNLAPFPQVIFTAPEEVVSELLCPFSHTLSPPDSEVGTQLPQTHHAQPPPDDVSPSTTSISNFQTPVGYSGSHHLDL